MSTLSVLLAYNGPRIGEEAEIENRQPINFLKLIREMNVQVQHVSRFFANTIVVRSWFFGNSLNIKKCLVK